MGYISCEVAWFLQLTGLLPMRLKREISTPTQITFSKILLVLSAAVFLASSALGSISCYKVVIDTIKTEGKNLLDYTIKTTYLGSRFFTHVSAAVVPLAAIVKAKDKERFLKRFSEFYFKINACQETWMSQIYFAILVLEFGKSAFDILKSRVGLRSIFLYHLELEELLFLCVTIEVCEVIRVVNTSFRKINDDTGQLLNGNLLMSSAKSFSPEGIPSKVNNAEQEILRLCEMHSELCCLLTLMKPIYQHQLLVLFCVVFLNLTFLPMCMHGLCQTADGSVNDNSQVVRFIVLLILIIHLIMSCNSPKGQISDMKTKVVSSMAKSTDANTTKYLEFFLNQLAVHKVEFSVCGMFSIKPSMMLAVLDVLFSYYLILWSVWN